MFISLFIMVKENEINILGNYHFEYNKKRYIIRSIFDKIYNDDIDSYNYLRQNNIIKNSNNIISLKEEFNNSNLFPKILDINDELIIVEYFDNNNVILGINFALDKNLITKLFTEFIKQLKNHPNFELYMKYININNLLYIIDEDRFVYTDFEEIYYLINKDKFNYDYLLDITINKKNLLKECLHLYITENDLSKVMLNDFTRYYKIIPYEKFNDKSSLYSKYFYY